MAPRYSVDSHIEFGDKWAQTTAKQLTNQSAPFGWNTNNDENDCTVYALQYGGDDSVYSDSQHRYSTQRHCWF
jgi:hypothetical protein